jgi:hypothetical protein
MMKMAMMVMMVIDVMVCVGSVGGVPLAAERDLSS